MTVFHFGDASLSCPVHELPCLSLECQPRFVLEVQVFYYETGWS